MSTSLKIKLAVAALKSRLPKHSSAAPATPAAPAPATTHHLTKIDLSKKRSITASLRSLFTGHSVHSTASTTSTPPREASVERQPRDTATAATPTPVDSATATTVAVPVTTAEGGAAGGTSEAAATTPTPVPEPTPSPTVVRSSTTRARELSPAQEQVYPQSHGKFIEEGIVSQEHLAEPIVSQPQEAHSYPAPAATTTTATTSSTSEPRSLKKKQSMGGETTKTVRFKTKTKILAAWTAFKIKMMV
ncbi:uncharacterized protein LTR77_011029 [Saxophila tyrrhenica]|uniref:Uncharacterized protein n=1 Tax=Saxophila tyrrhenica TaxID=1690608 RepID=A0AAV9NTZ5_9PEZI|nr:hypothetical protein LTR77_011029 [Saxophila tyrrhenica]